MASKQQIDSAILALEQKQFVERKALYDAIQNGKVPGEGSPIDGGPSFPPAHDAATALSNIRQGYGLEGIRGGRRLDPDYLSQKLKALPGILADARLSLVPADMVEWGFLYGLTEFDPNPSFASPFPGVENFTGKTLETYVAEYWGLLAAGGTPSGK